MSLQNLKTSQSSSLRAKQLKKFINQLKRKIKKIEKEGADLEAVIIPREIGKVHP